jgi:hypothetical protein
VAELGVSEVGVVAGAVVVTGVAMGEVVVTDPGVEVLMTVGELA